MKYRVEIREQAGSRERWTPACDETFTTETEARDKVASLLRRSLARFRVVPVALSVACGVLQ